MPVWKDNFWLLPFISIIAFTIASLLGFGGGLQKWYLLSGAILCFVASMATLGLHVKKDYILLALVFGSLAFWAVAYPVFINPIDDNTAYLVFAEQFNHGISGTLHPLSERRLFSVGASFSFQAPIMMFLGPRWLSLFEPVLGLALLFIVSLSSRERNQLSSTAQFFSCVLISILPLAGGTYVANTQSVYVLASCSFAILILCQRAYTEAPIGAFSFLMAGILCVYASLLRPTTLPFNIITLLSATAYSSWRLKTIQPYILPSLGIIAGFILSTYKYSSVFGTNLFPVVGRGIHITSFGHSTSSGVSMFSHAQNVFATIFTDPILLLATLLISLLLVFRNTSNSLFLIIPLSGLFLFSSLIVYTTGGLAAKRYIFPVSLSCLLYALSCLPQSVLFARSSLVRPSRQLRLTALVIVALMLFCPRLLAGEKVIQKRLLMYSPSGQDYDSIQRLKAQIEPALGRPSTALLVRTGIERFIVEEIKGKFIIMDQPGMMVPWMASNPRVSYEDGLRDYMLKQKIDFVIARTPFSSVSSTALSDSGSYVCPWSRLIGNAADANNRALFSILRDWERSEVGALTIYSRRSILVR